MFIIQTGLTEFPRLRFSANGQFLAVCDGESPDGEGFEIWRVSPERACVHRDNDVVLRGIEWNTCEAELYVPHNSALKIITPTGELLQTLPDAGWIRGMAFDPTGNWLVTFSPFQITGWKRTRNRWRPKWAEEIKVTEALEPGDSFESLALFPDGQRIVTLIGRRYRANYRERGRTIHYIDWQHLLVQRNLMTGQVLSERLLSNEEAPVGVRNGLTVTADGSQVIGFRGRSVCAWPTDLAKDARRTTVAKKHVCDVAVHPCGRWILVVCNNTEVSVWDTTTWKLVRTYDWGIGPVQCASISPDGLLATIGSDCGKVAVWDWDL